MNDLVRINQELQEENLRLRKRIQELEQLAAQRRPAGAAKKMRDILTEMEKIAHVGSFEYLVETQEMIWSAEEYRIYGLDPARQSPDYAVMLARCIHPDDAAMFHEKFTAAAADQAGFELEHRIVHPDGSIHWVCTRARPCPDEQGKPVRYAGTTVDITGSMKARKEISIFMESVENSSDAVGISTPEGEHYYQNKAFDRLFGRIDKHPADTVFVNRAVGEEVFRTIRAGGQWTGEVELYGKDGKIRTALLRAYASKDEVNSITALVGVLTDITGQKEAEQALRESEINYRALLNGMVDTVWVIDTDTAILDVNSAAAAVLGYSVSELTSLKISDIDRELTPQQIRDIAARMSNGRVQVFETCHTAKDGRKVPVEISSSPVTYKGKAAILCIARDITDRRKAEETLKKSEKLYRSLIDNIKDTFYRADTNGNLVMISPSGTTLLGYDSVEEMIGLNVAETLYLNPEDREKIVAAIKEREFVNDFEVKLKRRDGTAVETSTSSHKYYDENGVLLGIEGVVRDISDRKRAEEALRSSEERFSRAFHISPAPTIISSFDQGRYVDVNSAFLSMLGYTREEMIGRTAAELNVWANIDDRKKAARKLVEEGCLQGELLHLRARSGDIRYVLVSAETITLNGQKYILSIFYDITEQRRLETHLRQTQKMEAVGTLAGGIAHDFNNILGAIIGYTEMALDESNMGEQARCYLEQVYKAGKRAKDLVSRILTFSRKQDQETKPVLVAPIVEEGIKLLRSSLPATIRITRNITDVPVLILADATQIHQVLMNLCTNAAHAMREKGGVLDIQLRPEKVDQDRLMHPLNLAAGKYAKLTVSDTGGGIAASVMERIYDPFFTTKAAGEGTGLGLSVVYGIVRDYGGAIDIVSEPGKGTTVNVYFRREDLALPLLEQEPARMPGGPERILVVDDEVVLAELVNDMLTTLGYRVVAVSSSVAALEMFRARPHDFDLVITDITMPNMRGDDLARELLKIRPDIPIIICSGFDDTFSAEKAAAIGIRRFVMKPIFREKIAKAIREVLAG